MPKNAEIVTALQQLDFKRVPDIKRGSEAFRELLTIEGQTDDERAASLRQAINKHKGFWQGFLPPGTMDAPSGAAADYFTSNSFLTSEVIDDIQSFASLAALQLGIQTLNEAELRELLNLPADSDKAALRVLNKAFGGDLNKWEYWRLTEKPFQQAPRNLKILKNHAFESLVKLDIEKPETTIGQLEYIKKNPTFDGVKYPLTPETIELINKKIQQKASAQLEIAKRHIDSLSSEDLLNIKKASDFNDQLAEAGAEGLCDLADEEDAAYYQARNYCATRALEANLSNFKQEHLYNALKETEEARVDEALAKDKSAVKYHVDNASTDKWAFRQKLIIAWINKSPLKTSTDMCALSSLPDFIDYLKREGIQKVDACSPSDMDAMQGAARARIFESRTGNRPSLVLAFQQVTTKKQKELLESKESLAPILEADSPNVLKKQLSGLDNTLAQQIIDEKNNLDRFRWIHNPVLARVLSDIKPPIQLSLSKIHEINEELHDSRGHARHEDDYPHLLTAVAWVCEIEEGTLVTAMDKDAFHEQQDYNDSNQGSLFSLRGTIPEPYEKLVFLLLNLRKLKELDISSDLLRHVLERSPDVLAFGAILRLSKEEIEQLDHPVVHNAFEEAKRAMIAKKIVSQYDNAREEAVNAVKGILEPLQRGREILKRKSQDLRIVMEVEPARVFHELRQKFQAKDKAADAIEERYTRLAEECDEYIDKLQRDLKRLEDYGSPRVLFENQDNEAEVRPLRDSIQNQMRETQTLLNEFKELRKKLNEPNGILAAIKGAKEGTTYVAYKSRNFEAPYTGTRTAAGAAPAALQAGVVLNAAPSTTSTLSVEDRSRSGEKIYHDFEKKGGKFFYSERGLDKKDTSIPHSLKADNVAKESTLLQIEEFPADSKEQVAFAMGMASDILLRLDGPPTLKNLKLVGEPAVQVAFLWKALLVLAEVHPQNKEHPQTKWMSFKKGIGLLNAFGPEDLNCSHSKWQPNEAQSAQLDERFNSHPELAIMKKDFQELMHKKLGLKEAKSWGSSVTEQGSAAAETTSKREEALRTITRQDRKKYGPAEQEEGPNPAPAKRT